MRVIAGTAGGLNLSSPKQGGLELRPTQDKIRGAIFSMLGDAVLDAVALDLFAGTGSLGIEALSRGAAHASFVEQNSICCQALKKNLSFTKLEGKASLYRQDVFSFLRQTQHSFNLVLADPPYYKGRLPDDLREAESFYENLFCAVFDRLDEGGLFVFEFYVPTRPKSLGAFDCLRDKKYGETGVWLLQKPHTKQD